MSNAQMSPFAGRWLMIVIGTIFVLTALAMGVSVWYSWNGMVVPKMWLVIDGFLVLFHTLLSFGCFLGASAQATNKKDSHPTSSNAAG